MRCTGEEPEERVGRWYDGVGIVGTETEGTDTDGTETDGTATDGTETDGADELGGRGGVDPLGRELGVVGRGVEDAGVEGVDEGVEGVDVGFGLEEAAVDAAGDFDAGRAGTTTRDGAWADVL